MFHYSFYKCKECGTQIKLKSEYHELDRWGQCALCEGAMEKTPMEHCDIQWLIEYGAKGWGGYNCSNNIDSTPLKLEDYK